MNAIIGIYKITNITNNKCYIGKAINITYRWNSGHVTPLNKNKHGNIHLQRAWNKDKKNNFKFNIIEQCSKELLNEREIYWIAFYKSYDPKCGYNKTEGGDGGIPTLETKLKMSANHANVIGINNPRYGIKLEEETKQKISNSLKGNIVSEQARNNLSKALKGLKKPEGFGNKIAESNRKRKTDSIFQQRVMEKRIQIINRYSQETIQLIQQKLNEKYNISKIESELNITRRHVNMLIEFYNLEGVK